MEYKIPFNKVHLTGEEQENIEEALRSKRISGDGLFTHKCNAFLERVTGSDRALLTTSCTHSLEMCALLLDIKPGDEVIVPSFAFVTTANAFVLRGAKPVFTDIRPDTFNIDEKQVEGLISPRTKAIVALHYAGVACEMDELRAIANAHSIPIVEDSAMGLLGKFRGHHLGSLGQLATLSFHETKSFTCGEGGALLINDPKHVDRAEIIREKGTNRTQFFRGNVDKYTWVDLGSSYLPSEILAAFLLAQLESSDIILAKRRAIWDSYARSLADWAEANGVQLPRYPGYCEHPFHMFPVLCPSLAKRTQLISHLKSRGIQSAFHYQPLHLSHMGLKYGFKKGDFPVTEDVADRLVRLPFYTDLSPDEQHLVCEVLFELSFGPE
jgi:dTDP-4-amino-4,6-dideoxygalactose transaminase